MYTIYYKFTTLNKYISAERTNKFKGSSIKKTETAIVKNTLLNKKPFPTPCRLKFTWLIKNKRTDLDNIAFCKKFILDGIVQAKIIPDDTMKYVIGFVDEFEISNKEGVRIEVIE